jgi:CheY-like chemotaxis protein
MNTAGRDASLILRRLHDFYRPRDETDPMERVDLNKIVEEVVPLTQPKWKDHALTDGRTINVCLDLEQVPLLTSNATELREMFINLIFNAVDAMPGGGEITLRTRNMESMALMEVSDSGVGMDEETRRRCLEPFFTTKGEKGTGLGLAMVFGIVKRHEGTVEIESAPGRGTTIRIQLPITESKAHDLQDSEILERPLRVLVVDDEVISRDIVEKYLAADGHKVVTVGNAFDAISQFKAEPFDLVITDYAMPRMSGMDLAVVLRALSPQQKIIILTGFNIGTIPIQQRDKVSTIIPKPVGHSELRRALQALFAPKDAAVCVATEQAAA